MENQNGKGVIYGVISICTLIVAIIGATFAYFTANSKDENTVYGAAGSTSVSLSVTRVTRDALYDVKEDETASEPEGTPHRGYGYLLPVTDTEINTAVAGAAQIPEGQDEPTGDPVSCIDAKGNAACQVYKIEVSNSGNTPVTLLGKLEITPAGDALLKNLKWAKSTTATSGFTGAYKATTISDTENNQTAVTNLLDPVNGTETLTLDAGDTSTMYIVLWISETGAAQDEEDHGSFTGVVSFNSSGTGVTSTFSTNV